jgi:hypothetical protein
MRRLERMNAARATASVCRRIAQWHVRSARAKAAAADSHTLSAQARSEEAAQYAEAAKFLRIEQMILVRELSDGIVSESSRNGRQSTETAPRNSAGNS